MHQLPWTLSSLLLLCVPLFVHGQKKDSWDYQREGKYAKAMELARTELADAKKRNMLSAHAY